MASTSKHGFTVGPASVSSRAGYAGHSVKGADGRSIAAFPSTSKRPREERDANANLIAEAFTVAHETGLTPCQLAERCKELEAALSALIDLVDELGGDALGEEEDSRLGVARSVIAPKGGAA